ncbi:MAG: phospholipid carrier-dependent glycosyltransferase [Acidobacteria bacterium]|nr:phospholipid carrier-dependent glycosyltransferase [Acidobacteriota bacterium]MBV9478110.1 phospholipid carrier-dependent glycosyltransferase [Acidobacteriota bacterium]
MTCAAVPCFVLLAAAGAGTLAVGTRCDLPTRCALGLALFAHALFALALCGALRAGAVVALLVIAIAGGVRRGLRVPHADVATGAGIALFALLFPLALFPPLAFDETLYHLPFVRALARSGTLAFQPELRFPLFPQLHELLCAPVLLFAGDTATHLVAFAELIVTAALLVAWRPRIGLLAAALFLGSPLVLHLGTLTYVDAALAMFVTAGFVCLDRFLERDDRLSLLLTGVFCGTACGVKYLGGYFAVAAFVIVLILARDRVRAAPTLMITMLACALPTTLWLVANSGNPVFPFLPGVFGANVWSHPMVSMSAGARALRIARLTWDATVAREYVNAQPPVTPLLVVMLIVVLAAAMRDLRARCVAILCAAYVVIFTFLPQDSRYLVPLLPLLSMTAAAAIAARRPSLVNALACIAVAPGVLYIIYRLVVLGPPPLTPAAREAFLARHVPEYAAVQRAGTTRVYVCGGEQLKDYARGSLLGDVVGPFSIARVLGDAHDTDAIAARLRPLAIESFLVAKRVCPPPRANGGMELVYEDRAAQLWRVQPGNKPHSR